MRRWDLSHCAIGSCFSVALLAGCGASQPPIGSPLRWPDRRGWRALRDYGIRGHALLQHRSCVDATTRRESKQRGGRIMRLREFLSAGFVLAVSGCATLAPQAISDANAPPAARVERATASGTFTTLYSFQGQPDGANPQGSVDVHSIDASRKVFTRIYGNTSSGGTNDAGTIYELNATGHGSFSEEVLLNYAPSTTGSDPTGAIASRNFSATRSSERRNRAASTTKAQWSNFSGLPYRRHFRSTATTAPRLRLACSLRPGASLTPPHSRAAVTTAARSSPSGPRIRRRSSCRNSSTRLAARATASIRTPS